MHAFVASSFVTSWWFLAAASFALITVIAAISRTRHDAYSRTESRVHDFLNICDAKREVVASKGSVHFLHFIFPDSRLARRAWADVEMGPQSIIIWLEYSSLASRDDLVELYRFQEVLKSNGFKSLLNTQAVDQPEKPEEKKAVSAA